MLRLLLIYLLLICPLTANERVLIGIAGPSGSGKTTLAFNLLQRLSEDAVIISEDWYYRDLSFMSPEERINVNYDHPDSLDFSLLAQHLQLLQQGIAVKIPHYDFTTHMRLSKTSLVESRPIIIVEGILLFACPEIRDILDMKIYIETDDVVCLLRRIERDCKERGRTFDGVRRQYLTTVYPMCLQFIKPSKRYADIILPGGSTNEVGTESIISRCKTILGIS